MRGDTVIVRAYGGKALLRRVWDVGERVVYVTNDEEFDKLAAGRPAIEPIGFPKEDVFRVSETQSRGPNLDWSRLEMWSPTEGRLRRNLLEEKAQAPTGDTI
jgi:hypothetical protein